MAYTAHITCNAIHLSFNEAHIHSTLIMCPKKITQKKMKDGRKPERGRTGANFCVNFVCDKKEDKLQAGMQLYVLELKRMKNQKKSGGALLFG